MTVLVLVGECHLGVFLPVNLILLRSQFFLLFFIRFFDLLIHDLLPGSDLFQRDHLLALRIHELKRNRQIGGSQYLIHLL